MENFDKLIFGFILFVVTSVLTYLFRMRQLYAVTPKLFKISPISKSGSLCEVIIYNRGNQVEEDISVSLDPELSLELLASNSAELKLEKSSLLISRLHKGQEASALLLVENGILDFPKIISLTSKNTIGKPLKKIENVPPNYAKLFLGVVVFFSIFPAMIYSFIYYDKYKDFTADSELSSIYDLGWSNLSKYYYSELKTSYSNKEFPIRYIGTTKEGEGNILNFEGYNKTAETLEVTVEGKFRKKNEYNYFETISIPPMSKTKIAIAVPEKTAGQSQLEYAFSFSFGGEFIHGLIYKYTFE